MENCLHSEYCRHYTDGVNRKSDHHIRVTKPCTKYLALSCEKMSLIMEMETFCTGKEQACSIGKRKKFMEGKVR